MKITKVLIIISSMLIGLSAAHAAELGDGATSLNETYDDWVVSCAKNNEQKTQCNLSQRVVQKETNKQVILMTLQPNKTDLIGELILPFGISLKEGVQLKLDDKKSLPTLAFSTCLPVGCIAPVSFDADAIKQLTTAKQLTLILAAPLNQEPIKLAISLKGLSKATARASALSKG